MKLYTFTGESPTEALKKAQRVCGLDALVVNTRLIRKKTLTKSALYEVVVAKEDEKKDVVEDFDEKDLKNKQKEEKNLLFDTKEIDKIEKKVDQIEQIDLLDIDFDRSKKQEVQNKNQKELLELKKSLEEVNKKMLELQKLLLQKEDNLILPTEFVPIYTKLKEAGVKKRDINEIVGESIKYMPSYMKTNEELIERYFRVLLKKMIPIRKEFPLKKQKIIMLVGATGVGKTTTLAKLAARYSLLEFNYKVGIITLDTYRIGAVEQLFQYAKMMKLPIEDVIGEKDFKAALNRYMNMDLILIDTVGSSQYDRQKLQKLKMYLNSCNKDVEVSLVVAANAKMEDLEEVYKAFSTLNLSTMIITKFDETKTFGNLFSLIKEVKLPLTYFSVGQEVPDDLKLANAEFLIKCIFEGFSNARL